MDSPAKPVTAYYEHKYTAAAPAIEGRLKERAKVRNKNVMTLSKGDKVRLVNFKKAKDPDQYKDEPNWWPDRTQRLCWRL